MKKNNPLFRAIGILPFIILFLITNSSIFAQKPDYDKYWEYWEYICYCSINNSYHPSTILSADNNLEIFFALSDGLTRKQLNALNIPNKHSQLMLLETYKLIDYSNGIYKTTIPILDTLQTTRLREQSKLTANKIYPKIEKECRELVEYLKSQNLSNNAYSILYSYVFDGLIWDQFEKEKIIAKMDKNEIWSGYFWFLTPKRNFDCGGTNSWTEENTSFKCNWAPTENVTDKLWDMNIEALFPIASGKKTPNKDIINEFFDYGFFNNNYKLLIPVINEKENNPLCLLANNIVEKLFTAFVSTTDIEELKTSYKFRNNSETVVVFYHELMFDLMDLLLEKQIIQIPTAFQHSKKSTIRDISDLCFIVISK